MTTFVYVRFTNAVDQMRFYNRICKCKIAAFILHFYASVQLIIVITNRVVTVTTEKVVKIENLKYYMRSFLSSNSTPQA